MSEARRVALAVLEHLNRGDVDGLLELADPDVRWRVPRLDGSGDIRGREAVRAGIFARIPQFLEAPPQLEVEDLIAEGECAFVRARGSARTRSGALHENRYALFYRVRAGKLIEVEEFLDTAKAAVVVFGRRIEEGRSP